MKHAQTSTPEPISRIEGGQLQDFQVCKCEFRKPDENASPQDATPSGPVAYPDGTSHLIWVCDHCGGLAADGGFWTEVVQENLLRMQQKSKKQGLKISDIPWHLYFFFVFATFVFLWIVYMMFQFDFGTV